MKRLAAPTLVLVAALVIWASVMPKAQRVAAVTGGSPPERIWTNDNREPAGELEAGVLTLWLEAREGLWYPEGPDGKAYAVAAFAEEGGPLLNPGPLIRVPVGTEIRMRVRNSLRDTLRMFGLGEVRSDGEGVAIAPAGVRELRFVATNPGTYYYAGKTDSLAPTLFGLFGRRREDSQLNGVIVVDPAGMTTRPDERIFLISWWIAPETTEPAILAKGTTLVINGRSWPNTERIETAQGDTLHWKWISMTAAPHPMHLHGHYFRVDAKGDGVNDTIYSSEQQRLAVTETLLAGQTMSIAWSPERAGNWIFHCHLAAHIRPGVPEDGTARETDHGAPTMGLTPDSMQCRGSCSAYTSSVGARRWQRPKTIGRSAS